MKSLRATRTACHVLLFLLAAASVCHADQVTLDNGDRLTGTVKRIGGGSLVIGTEYAGDITINLKRIAALQTDSDMTVVLDDDTRLYGRLSGTGQTLEIAEHEPVEMTRVSNVEPGRVTGKEWKFSGRLALGASESSGNTSTRNLHWDGEFVALQDANRYSLGGRGDYGSANGTQNQDDTIIYGQYDRLLSKKWYAYVNASLENNRFSDIYLRTVGGVGVGYQWLDTERTKLALEAGPSYVYTDYYTRSDEHNLAARLVTKFDYWVWPHAVQFFNYNEFYPSLEQYENSFLRSQIGLRFPLVDKFLATAQWNLDWNGNPPPGKVKLDQTVILTLGYRW